MRRRITTFLLTILFSTALFAQVDSAAIVNKSIKCPAFEKRCVQSTYIGLPLIAASLIEMGENHHFRSLRNDFIPDFRHHLDDRIQYAPGAVMLGMKIAGVEGRNSWGKMLTADAFSAGILFASTHLLKRTTHEERPDATNLHSFPSGHTSTAFMMATMLDREYGHLSPWISYGGYTVATATGVMRIMNNKHWMNDVLAGAGFGIMCTEFGYWLSDLCFPKEKTSFNSWQAALLDSDRKPSFVGINAGFYLPIGGKSRADGRLHASTGSTASIEGAYFFDGNWGVGAQVGVANIGYKENGGNEEVASEHFVVNQLGGYFAQDIYDRLFLRAKMLGGCVEFPTQDEVPAKDARKVGLCATTGIALGLRAKDHFDVTAGVDYSMNAAREKSCGPVSSLVFSGSATIRF